VCYQAQQVSQRDAPPVGGFEVLVFIKVRRLRFAFVSGAPLTVTLDALFFVEVTDQICYEKARRNS